jgi:FMN-dependent oxidoreductase (nitrilotriacetate monooxygenase family)
MNQRQMVLNLFLATPGSHTGAWRSKNSRAGEITKFSLFRDIALEAERAKFHALFLADLLSAGHNFGKQPLSNQLEPLTMSAALAVVTQQIGLVSTASTSFTEPYNLARYFASIDHISSGRAAWNIVTSFTGGENFSVDLAPHEERYRAADEYVDLVTRLWDSWNDDAIIDDRENGYWADPRLIRRINFEGEYFKVAGPLNLPRPPQGWPVLVQAGSSSTGIDFAARRAEIVFTAQQEMGDAQKFYRSLKSLAVAAGRSASDVHVLPGIMPIIGSTESEARKIANDLSEMLDFNLDRRHLNYHLGDDVELGDLNLDEPIPASRLKPPEQFEGNRSRYSMLFELAVNRKYTLRELMKTQAAGGAHLLVIGTAEQVADEMELWFNSGACDGFNVKAPYLMEGLLAITQQVIPILMDRGLFRKEYCGSTLRENLGLARPASG